MGAEYQCIMKVCFRSFVSVHQLKHYFRCQGFSERIVRMYPYSPASFFKTDLVACKGGGATKKIPYPAMTQDKESF